MKLLKANPVKLVFIGILPIILLIIIFSHSHNVALDFQLGSLYIFFSMLELKVYLFVFVVIYLGSYFIFSSTKKPLNTILCNLHFWMSIIPFYSFFYYFSEILIITIPRRYYSFTPDEAMNNPTDFRTFFVISAICFLLGQILFIVNIVNSTIKKRNFTSSVY